jgi:IS5 family transposase
LSRFCGELAVKGGIGGLLSAINRELSNHQLIMSHGIKAGASLTETPRKPKGKISYEIAEGRHEGEAPEEKELKQTSSLKKQRGKGVDADGRWI